MLQIQSLVVQRRMVTHGDVSMYMTFVKDLMTFQIYMYILVGHD